MKSAVTGEIVETKRLAVNGERHQGWVRVMVGSLQDPFHPQSENKETFLWGSRHHFNGIVFEIIPAVPKFLYYFAPLPLELRKHGCDLASFPQFPFCSNFHPISTADEPKWRPGLMLSQTLKLNISELWHTQREAGASRRDGKEPRRGVRAKGLPCVAEPSILGCQPQLGNLLPGPRNLTDIWRWRAW